MQTIKDTLLTLARAYGATGRESNIASTIRGMIEPYVDEIEDRRAGQPHRHPQGWEQKDHGGRTHGSHRLYRDPISTKKASCA